MNSLLSREEQIINLCYTLTKNNNIYKYLYYLGKQISYYPLFLNKKNLLSGCQYKIWLYFIYKNNKIYILSYSDSILMRGLTFLLSKLYSNNLPINIINYKSYLLKHNCFKSCLSKQLNKAIQILITRIRYQSIKYLI
ncbi:SufE family protein [Candidatus Karelsulcia muelleri]